MIGRGAAVRDHRLQGNSEAEKPSPRRAWLVAQTTSESFSRTGRSSQRDVAARGAGDLAQRSAGMSRLGFSQEPTQERCHLAVVHRELFAGGIGVASLDCVEIGLVVHRRIVHKL